MGRLLQSLGKLKEAEPFFRRLLELSERTLGRDHPNTRNAATGLRVLLEAMEKEK